MDMMNKTNSATPLAEGSRMRWPSPGGWTREALAKSTKVAQMRLVLVESPYAAPWFWQRWLNRRYARACMKDALKRGEAPFASHLLYTQAGVLKDKVLPERSLGIRAGLAWGKRADATAVYVDRGISPG